MRSGVCVLSRDIYKKLQCLEMQEAITKRELQLRDMQHRYRIIILKRATEPNAPGFHIVNLSKTGLSAVLSWRLLAEPGSHICSFSRCQWETSTLVCVKSIVELSAKLFSLLGSYLAFRHASSRSLSLRLSSLQPRNVVLMQASLTRPPRFR